MNYKKIVSDLLREFADKIDTGNTNITLEEAIDLMSTIAHVSMTKQQVADRYGVSPKTIERREHDGLIPPGHKVISSKKVWYLDELKLAEEDV